MIYEYTEESLNRMTMLQLVELKEYIRQQTGLYIENDMVERGTMNHKTKEYFSCDFTKRIQHPTKKGMKWNSRSCFRTFDTYREALIFSLLQAPSVNERIDAEDEKNKETVKRLSNNNSI